jgi:hypothetical protein
MILLQRVKINIDTNECMKHQSINDSLTYPEQVNH